MKIIAKKGFTLIEVLIAATIFAMIMVMVVGIFSWASSYNSKLREMRKMNQDGRKIVNMISDDIRQANGSVSIVLGFSTVSIGELAVLNCANLNSCTVDSSYLSDIDNNIDLESAPYNNGLLIINNKDDKAVFYLEYNNNVIRSEKTIAELNLGFYEITPLPVDAEDYYINNNGVDVKLGFAGYTPLIDGREAQPCVKIKMLAETEDYDNVHKTFRANLNLETTVSSREYNIYE